MSFEPVLISNLVAAGIALAIAFGAPVTPEQRDALLGFVAAFIALLIGAGVVARANVYSRASVEKLTGHEDPPVP